MDEDHAIKRGAIIDLRKIEEIPVLYVPIRIEHHTVLDTTGKELVVQALVAEADGRKLYFVLKTEPHDHERRHIIHSSNRPIESRGGDHGYFRDKILEPRVVDTPDGPKKALTVEIMTIDGPKRFSRFEDAMMFLEERPDNGHAADDDAPGGAKYLAARDAITALWPDGIPRIAAKDRNRMVVEWCREHKRSIPGERTIERVAADMARP
jgi:hypothetical protein